jgi:hypothetical protein
MQFKPSIGLIMIERFESCEKSFQQLFLRFGSFKGKEMCICLVEFSFGGGKEDLLCRIFIRSSGVFPWNCSLVCRGIFSNFHLGEFIFNLIFKFVRNLMVDGRIVNLKMCLWKCLEDGRIFIEVIEILKIQFSVG